MAGTISINIDELQSLVSYLKQIKDTLDGQKDLVPSLKNQLDDAITGTVPGIATFEQQCAYWFNVLNSITTDMDKAYLALSTVLIDTQDAASSLNI
jgi:hypothetical protein